MTRLQYRRWYDFARRMALRTMDVTPARRAKIMKEVRHILWILENDVPEIASWDGPGCYVGDEVDRILYDRGHNSERQYSNGNVDQREHRFINQVSCCIRAGLDVALTPSAGVLGWTVGDLRRMYPLGLPAWVASYFVEPITTDVSDEMGVWL